MNEAEKTSRRRASRSARNKYVISLLTLKGPNHILFKSGSYKQKSGLVSACYLGKWLGTRVQFPSVDVKLSPFVPEPPGVQQVAVVLDPALDTWVLQHIAW